MARKRRRAASLECLSLLNKEFCDLNITQIEIKDKNLVGEISTDIAQLKQLSRLDLSNNNLYNGIPDEITQLEGLRNLDLSQNHNLRGEIPAEMLTMQILSRLSLADCGLSGNIPSNISSVNLSYLDLAGNELQGAIPSSIGNLKPTRLFLGRNQLSGKIPAEIGNLGKISELSLKDNQLSGLLPDEIGNLKVIILDVSKNNLSGEIPSSIGNIGPDLEELILHNNNFTGNLPADLSKLNNLRELEVNYNSLSGDFPAFLLNLDSLKVLKLSFNDFTGGIQFGQWPKLETLRIEKAGFVGELPEIYSEWQLKKIKLINLEGNGFTGTIPESWGKLTSLTSLKLGGNNLEGRIPESFAQLSNLKKLELKDNKLSGRLPPELAFLPSLTTLLVGGTNIICTEVALPPTLNHDVPFCAATNHPTLFPTGLPTASPTQYPFVPPVEEIDTSFPSSFPTGYNPNKSGASIGFSDEGMYVYGGYVVLVAFIFLFVLMYIKLWLPVPTKSEAATKNICHDDSFKSVESDLTVDSRASNSSAYIGGRRGKIFGSLLSIFLVLGDFLSDVLFCVSLFLSTDKEQNKLATYALIFIVLPILCNIGLVMMFSHQFSKSAKVRDWIEKNDLLTTCLQCLSIFSLESFVLASCGMCCFTMPLSKFEIYKLRAYTIINNFVEDLPQLSIVIMSRTAAGGGKWPIFAIISLLMSVGSLIWTLLFRFQSCSLVYHYNADRKENERVESSNASHSSQSVAEDVDDRENVADNSNALEQGEVCVREIKTEQFNHDANHHEDVPQMEAVEPQLPASEDKQVISKEVAIT